MDFWRYRNAIILKYKDTHILKETEDGNKTDETFYQEEDFCLAFIDATSSDTSGM